MSFSLSISVVSRISGILLDLGGGSLVLFTNVVELLHILEEIIAAAQCDEQFGLFTVTTVVGGRHSDRFSADFFESGVLVSKIQKLLTNIIQNRAKQLTPFNAQIIRLIGQCFPARKL